MMLDENVVLFTQGFMNVALCSTGVLTLSLVLNQVIYDIYIVRAPFKLALLNWMPLDKILN